MSSQGHRIGMATDLHKHNSARSRASKACKRCSRRKVKCDATEVSIPCTRCRLDKASNCELINSRRGTYPRNKSHSDHPSDRPSIIDDGGNSVYPPDNINASLEHANALYNPSQQHRQRSNLSPSPVQMSDLRHGETVTTSSSVPSFGRNPLNTSANKGDFRPVTSSTSSIFTETSAETPDTANGHSSLASMFEEFLIRQGQGPEGVVGKSGIIYFSGSSPLTFALEELQRGEKPSLYDAGPHLPNTDSAEDQRNAHPSHLSPPQISYLKSMAAFDCPRSEILNSIVSAFLDRFHALYSILDKAEFVRLHEAQKLPWILLHAVCFIGSTFCETSVIHRAGFKGRWHARRHFYDKAKVLFDVGYETNKIVLLQTVIMLSFWGPQMKSYWNPCSWIGFGVTIAESLGIHRSTSSAHMDCKNKSLLRRLWWTLAVRDAYCAALLGRPFRINIAQCDTEMLSLENFDHSATCSEQQVDPECHVHALYQIQIAKLSLVLRHIIESRFGPTTSATTIGDLHEMLNQWQTEMPPAVDWNKQGSASGIFAASLKIIFHHHLIFIHLGKPHQVLDEIEQIMNVDSTASQIVESAAQMISSTAFTLMTNSMVSSMPHETFPGFFIAGIVFYRQFRTPQKMLAQLGRASLDNCQMVMNEARECWDPAPWVMRIFDFLLSGANNTDTTATADVEFGWQNSTRGAVSSGLNEVPKFDENNVITVQENDNNNNALHFINLESPQNLDLARSFTDFLLMPSYFGATPESWSAF